MNITKLQSLLISFLSFLIICQASQIQLPGKVHFSYGGLDEPLGLDDILLQILPNLVGGNIFRIFGPHFNLGGKAGNLLDGNFHVLSDGENDLNHIWNILSNVRYLAQPFNLFGGFNVKLISKLLNRLPFFALADALPLTRSGNMLYFALKPILRNIKFLLPLLINFLPLIIHILPNLISLISGPLQFFLPLLLNGIKSFATSTLQGLPLLLILKGLFRFFLPLLVNGIISFATNTLQGLPLLLTLVGPFLLMLPSILQNIAPLIENIIGPLLYFLPSILQNIVPLIANTIGPLLHLLPFILPNIAPLIANIIGPLLHFLPFILQNIGPLVANITGPLLYLLPLILRNIFPLIENIIGNILLFLPSIVPNIATFLIGILRNLPNLLQLISPFLLVLPFIIQKIAPFIVNLLGSLLPFLPFILHNVAPLVIQLVGRFIFGVLPYLLPAIEAFLSLLSRLLVLFSWSWHAIQNGLTLPRPQFHAPILFLLPLIAHLVQIFHKFMTILTLLHNNPKIWGNTLIPYLRWRVRLFAGRIIMHLGFLMAFRWWFPLYSQQGIFRSFIRLCSSVGSSFMELLKGSALGIGGTLERWIFGVNENGFAFPILSLAIELILNYTKFLFSLFAGMISMVFNFFRSFFLVIPITLMAVMGLPVIVSVGAATTALMPTVFQSVVQRVSRSADPLELGFKYFSLTIAVGIFSLLRALEGVGKLFRDYIISKNGVDFKNIVESGLKKFIPDTATSFAPLIAALAETAIKLAKSLKP